MRVAVDARCLNVPHIRGIGRYTEGVISGPAHDVEISWLLIGDRPEQPIRGPVGGSIRRLAQHVPGHRFHTWEQLWLPALARRERADVLHCVANTGPAFQPVPTVITVHDTLLWDELGDRHSLYLGRIQELALNRAAALITISESSRRDILRRWPNLAPKLVVIPHGIDNAFLDSAPHARPALVANRGRYVLYVGGSLPRKRFDWAARVWRSLASPRPALVVCGFANEEVSAAKETLDPTEYPSVVFAPFIPAGDMPGLFYNAAAVLYPSLYEGFGFPVVEANAVGTPILFSALGSLAELQGPCSVVLPEDDLAAWTDALSRILSGNLRRGSTDGRTWARQFSWSSSAAKHLEVYKSILK